MKTGKGKKNKAEQGEESSKTFKKLRHKHPAVESDINRLEHHGLDWRSVGEWRIVLVLFQKVCFRSDTTYKCTDFSKSYIVSTLPMNNLNLTQFDP